jgi:hypothetical protein
LLQVLAAAIGPTLPNPALQHFVSNRGRRDGTHQRSSISREAPLCCFCGGSTAAQTSDHQPAKIIFPNKSRPAGLEFPACTPCNKQTSVDECVVGCIARIAGSTRNPRAKIDSGYRKCIKSIQAELPLFLPSLKSRKTKVLRNGLWISQPVFDFNNAQIHSSACRVAAKLALATYYDRTGTIASPSFRINTLCVHNQNPAASAVDELLAKFPSGKHLQQGKWDTSDTFFIRFILEGTTLHMGAVLHESVLLMAQLGDTAEAKEWHPWRHTWAPVPGKGIVAAKLT